MNRNENTGMPYHRELLTIDLRKANRYAFFVLLIAVVLFGIPYYCLWTEQFTAAHIKSTYHYLATRHRLLLALIPLLVLVAGIVVHELIHGLTWALFAPGGHRSVKYGVLWKYVTPYCHCKEPLEVRHYVLGALMPAVILGILPSIAGIITGNFYVLVTGIFFVMAAAGDFMIIYLLRGEKRSNRVLDHPNEAGCYIYRQG